jgi:hypothetical protein
MRMTHLHRHWRAGSINGHPKEHLAKVELVPLLLQEATLGDREDAPGAYPPVPLCTVLNSVLEWVHGVMDTEEVQAALQRAQGYTWWRVVRKHFRHREQHVQRLR